LSINERYSDFVDISLDLADEIVKSYDNSLSVSSMSEIKNGRANSNYILVTTKMKMVLRICRNKSAYDHEIIIDRELDNSIKRPELLYHTIHDDIPYLLYQYIESNSLGDYKEISNDIIGQVAIICAHIHNTPIDRLRDIEKFDLPPFEVWYDHFLDNQYTIRRVGIDLQVRIKKIVKNSFDKLGCIDSIHTVIHNDFRLDNMIVDKHNNVFITDWEGVTVNHMITDMGQFFRLIKKFSSEQLNMFEHYYNTNADVPLPVNWYELSRLRDLVSLLQLISSEQDLPIYHKKLKTLIIETVEYFESV